MELAFTKPVGVSKMFHLLDATGSSHGPHATGVAATHDDSSPDVHRTALPIRTI
jgi:hypothetical protein